MKRVTITLLAAIILIGSAVSAGAADRGYTFGVFWDSGTKQNASFSMMSKDITKAFTLTQGIQLSNLFFGDLEQFHDAITRQKLDFIYANTEDDFLLAIMYGYKPIASIAIFGKEKASHCVYVQKGSDIKDVAGLKGKKIITYPHLVAYTLLRKLVGAAPEKTFSAMDISTDAYSTVDALAQGKVDAIFLVETNIDFFNKVNPGPVKKIEKLACTDPLYFMPIMTSPAVDDEMIKHLETFYLGMYKNDQLKKYRPFMKQIDLKVIPVTDKNYEPFFILYEFTLAQSWDKDYESWLTSKGIEIED